MDPQILQKKNITGNLFNRFESLVFPDHPELPALKRSLLESGAEAALMSGSGSSVFGLVATREKGEEILAQIQSQYPQSWLVHTL
jgi:4-diphosphocytidyl-2-C-methyl-D-erythritol kinase